MRVLAFLAGRFKLRYGVAQLISSSVSIGGANGSVGSEVETLFDLAGLTVAFAGPALPFRPGDQAIVAGAMAASGVFQADAVSLPARGIVIHAGSAAGVLIGSAALAAGLYFLWFGLFGTSWDMGALPARIGGIVACVIGSVMLLVQHRYRQARDAVVRQGRIAASPLTAATRG